MTADREANAAERRRWNDSQWAAAWLRREVVTDSVSELVLAHLSLVPGERLLEIGSGGGKLSMAAAGRVTPGGTVVGVDISEPLVELARARTAEVPLGNVTFLVADAQTDPMARAPFDAATSQFGVMFFDEPATAFANVARHLRPGGRLTFACWQRIEHNPWFVGVAMAPYVPPGAEPGPGKSPIGPFTLSDPDRVTELLTSAGWADVDRTPYERTELVERQAIFDDIQLRLSGIAEADLDDARGAVERHLARFDLGDGRLEIPLAFQIFTARRR